MLRFTPWLLLLVAVVHFINDPTNAAVALFGAGSIIFISWAGIIHLYNKLRKHDQRLKEMSNRMDIIEFESSGKVPINQSIDFDEFH